MSYICDFFDYARLENILSFVLVWKILLAIMLTWKKNSFIYKYVLNYFFAQKMMLSCHKHFFKKQERERCDSGHIPD